MERRFGDLPVEQMDGAQRAVNDRLVAYLYPERAGTDAAIGGPMAALLRSPELAELTGHLVPFFFGGLCLPRDVTEVVVLLTARKHDCHFMFHTHRRYADKAELDPDIVEDIATAQRPTMSDELAAAYDFASELLRDGDVSDAAFAAVTVRWGQRGAVEIIATVGFYAMLALVLNVDRFPLPPQGGARALPSTASQR